MANRLNMAKIQAIEQLQALKWSQRKIARELGVDRGAVARHLHGLEKSSKAAIPPTGSSDPKAATFPPSPGTFSIQADQAGCAASDADSKAAIPPTGSASVSAADLATQVPSNFTSSGSPTRGSPAGRRSQCEMHREVIQAKLDQQLTAQRIWQDLVADHGFSGKYDSVKRFVRRLGQHHPLPFRRIETPPGEEAQVDFGTGAWVVGPDGKRRKTHVFRIVLSYSRKAYSESTFTQTTDDFLRALENAFHAFGGVPKTLVIDNLKAAVAHPDWFDPELTPKVQSFCRHYGTVILPTKPYMPRHKGKVESGVKYVQSNALKGRVFPNNEAQNRFPRRVGNRRGRHAHPRHHQAPSEATLQGRTFLALASTARTVRFLPRGAAEGQPRRARRSGQGVLLHAARISWANRLGSLGRPARADIQPSLRTSRAARSARAGPLQHAGRTHRTREDQPHRARRRLLAGQGRLDRPAIATMVGSHAPCPRHRGHAGAARVVEPDSQAHRRSPGKSLRNRPFPRRFSSSHPPALTRS